MKKGTVKTILAIGVVLLLFALIIGPTTTTTETKCTDSTLTQPPQCYDVTETTPNPPFWFFIGLGSLMSGPSFWWLVIRSAVKSGQEDQHQ